MSGDLAARLRERALGYAVEELGPSDDAGYGETPRTDPTWRSEHEAGTRCSHTRWGVCLLKFWAGGVLHECERPGHHPGGGHRCRCSVRTFDDSGRNYEKWARNR